VFAALALMRSPVEDKPVVADPLGELASKAATPGEGRPERLDSDDVTFPGVLTDQDNPTTAMAAVRRGAGSNEALEADELPRHVFESPPPATDRLQVMPLPAQDVLSGSQATIAPSDTLRTMAKQVAKEPEGATLAEQGQPGGYQLQVSSFKEQADADAFVLALRRRGHRAYVQPAHVQGRGLWHRVRIGPFRYKRSAEIYRQDFEAKERMITFIVDPPKAKIHVALAEDE
jgi:cell division protein FtsN